MVKYKRARKFIEAMYEGSCAVFVQGKARDPKTHETVFKEVLAFDNVPCRLSFKASPAAGDARNASALSQTARIFISPDIKIPPGSKIVVTQNGETTAYALSGEPSRYATHQEISLELFRGYA